MHESEKVSALTGWTTSRVGHGVLGVFGEGVFGCAPPIKLKRTMAGSVHSCFGVGNVVVSNPLV